MLQQQTLIFRMEFGKFSDPLITGRARSAHKFGEVENSETSENQFPEVFRSEFSILHCTQNRKLGVENLGVFSKAL